MAYELLKQVNDLLTEKEGSAPKVAKTTAKAVYRRDYIRTKNKSYRTKQKKHSTSE